MRSSLLLNGVPCSLQFPMMQPNPPEPAKLIRVGEWPAVHQVGLWQDVMFVCWVGPANAEAVRKLGTIAQSIMDDYGRTALSFVHLVPSDVPLPDAATRSALTELTQQYGKHTACVAVIIAGAGFWASAMRGLATGLHVLAPKAFDLRIHGAAAAEDLRAWFPKEHAQRTGTKVEADDLVRCLEEAQSWVSDARSPAAGR